MRSEEVGMDLLKGELARQIVCIESPFAGRGTTRLGRWLDARQNLQYARAAVKQSLLKYGEAPFASHLLYTQPGILRDAIGSERLLGINAGLRFQELAAYIVVYIDRGVTAGMEMAIKRAEKNGLRVVYRSLYEYGSSVVIVDGNQMEFRL